MRRGVVTAGDTFGTSLRDAILAELGAFVVEKVIIEPSGGGKRDITVITTRGSNQMTSSLSAGPDASDEEIAAAVKELVSNG